MLNTNNTIKTATINTLPKATHQGKLKLDGVEIDVAILSNNMRVISVKSLYKLFGFKYGSEQDSKLPEFLSADYLKPYFSDELTQQATNKISYFDLYYNQTECFDVAIIPLVTELFIKAKFNKYVKQRIVEKAYRISAILYLKGAEELIDEVLLKKRKPRQNVLISKVYFLKEPPHAIEATIPYGNVNITVTVVEDTHVILASDINKIMGMELEYNLVDGLPAYASPKFIRKHLSGSLLFMLTNKIRYKNKQNNVQNGYDVQIIELLYKAYTKAFIAGDIKTQKAYNGYLRLRRIFMNVSIVSLISMIDEAVEYERREDEANVSILNDSLTKQAVLTSNDD